MVPPCSDTIYALSTVPGRSGIAVIRVSGPQAFDSLKVLIPNQPVPLPRQAQIRRLAHAGKPIDAALILVFQSPASFTGENLVEYHVHGGWSVMQSLLHALAQQSLHRMALPGEFTRRAFEHGKLDLTEAEAIGDLIAAETEAQRLQALDQLSGTLENLYTSWSDRLTRVLALMEADLDFSDQDLPDDLLLRVSPDLNDLVILLKEHLDDDRRGERLRDGFRITILGAPNVGKSSLLNALAQREAAIVSPVAGTTRDIIEVHLDLGGFPVIISDTAGLREELDLTTDTIEREGIRRALQQAQRSDLKLLIFETGKDQDQHTKALLDDDALVIFSKNDLYVPKIDSLSISTLTGSGINDLLEAIKTRLALKLTINSTPTLTRTRHREALQHAVAALQRAIDAPLPELAAEDVRLAVRFIGSITGRVDVEDLLDMIFRDFCIGK